MKCHYCKVKLIKSKGHDKTIYFTCENHAYFTIENKIITYYNLFNIDIDDRRYILCGKNYFDSKIHSILEWYIKNDKSFEYENEIRLEFFVPMEIINREYDCIATLNKFRKLMVFS